AQVGAQSIHFAGAVFGCFFTAPGGGPPPCATVTAPPGQAFDGNLQYQADGFNGTTLGGIVAFSDGPTGSFGHMEVDGAYAAPPGKMLWLQFIFSDPIAPDQFQTASIIGAVTAPPGGKGGILVIFGAPATFAFTTKGGAKGIATLSVNSFSIGADKIAAGDDRT